MGTGAHWAWRARGGAGVRYLRLRVGSEQHWVVWMSPRGGVGICNGRDPQGPMGMDGGLQPKGQWSGKMPAYLALVPAFLVQALGCQTTHSNQEVLQSCSLVFFATKPHIVPAVLAEVACVITSEHILVSVAAGVSLSTLEEVSGPWGEVGMRL